MAEHEVDVVPQMIEDLLQSVENKFLNDKQMQRILNTELKTGFKGEISLLCDRLGQYGADSFIDIVLKGDLPDGEPYYNIADRTYTALMEKMNELVNKMAVADDIAMQNATRTRIKPSEALLDKDRVNTSLEKLLSLEDAQRVTEAREIIPNVTQSMYDRFVLLNAEKKARSGLAVYIIRIAEKGACKWCRSLNGKYNYGEEPEDVYHRHDNCRCTVEHRSARGKQDVWAHDVVTSWR